MLREHGVMMGKILFDDEPDNIPEANYEGVNFVDLVSCREIIRYNEGDGKEGEPIVFNYIGRVLHDKGVDDYIEAAKRIKAKYPQTEFNMLGFIEPTEIHYEEDLRILGEQGIVMYRGSQNDRK